MELEDFLAKYESLKNTGRRYELRRAAVVMTTYKDYTEFDSDGYCVYLATLELVLYTAPIAIEPGYIIKPKSTDVSYFLVMPRALSNAFLRRKREDGGVGYLANELCGNYLKLTGGQLETLKKLSKKLNSSPVRSMDAEVAYCLAKSMIFLDRLPFLFGGQGWPQSQISRAKGHEGGDEPRGMIIRKLRELAEIEDRRLGGFGEGTVFESAFRSYLDILHNRLTLGVLDGLFHQIK